MGFSAFVTKYALDGFRLGDLFAIFKLRIGLHHEFGVWFYGDLIVSFLWLRIRI